MQILCKLARPFYEKKSMIIIFLIDKLITSSLLPIAILGISLASPSHVFISFFHVPSRLTGATTATFFINGPVLEYGPTMR